MGRFMEAQTSFSELPEQEQPEHMGLESSQCVHWMLDYICDHREPMKLLLCKAEGTSYEHFVHNMVEAEVEYNAPLHGCSPPPGPGGPGTEPVSLPHHRQRNVQRPF